VRDLALNRTQNPHVLKYIPVFPCGLVPTDAPLATDHKQILI